jgi:hypothetical protein
VGSHRELMPIFALESAEGLTVHGCPWKNDKEKVILGTAVKLECQRRKVFQYSFVCEAWALELASVKELHLRPSKDPRRIEVVLALAVNRQEKKIRQWKIERSEDGICTGLTPSREDGGKGKFESWMAELLE